MAARTPTGEWCSPTREITTTHLIRLIDESRPLRLIGESRPREAVVEVIHDAPPPECPVAAPELLERPRCSTRLIDPRSLAEPEVEQAPATPGYAPTTQTEMPPAATPAQRIAIGARRGGKHLISGRLLLGLGVLVLLCLWGVVFLDLDTWGLTDASIQASLGL